MQLKIHLVKKGDTLYELSQKYHVELDQLIAANPQIANPDVIDVGMKVKIPDSPKPVQQPTDYLYKHVVVQGDTLWKLGKAWGVPLADMVAANQQLKNPNVLMTGEIVYIPKLKSDTGPSMHHHLAKADTSVMPLSPLPVEEAPMMPEAPQAPLKEEAPGITPYPNIQMPTPNIWMQSPNIGMPTPNIEMPTPNIEMPTPNIEMPTPNVGMPSMEPTYAGNMPPVANLFQQFQVPATEVMMQSPWATEPELPVFPNQPKHGEMPYTMSTPNVTYSPYPSWEAPAASKGCGCGQPNLPYALPQMNAPYGQEPLEAYPNAPYGQEPLATDPNAPYGQEPLGAYPNAPYGQEPLGAYPNAPYGQEPLGAYPNAPYGQEPLGMYPGTPYGQEPMGMYPGTPYDQGPMGMYPGTPYDQEPMGMYPGTPYDQEPMEMYPTPYGRDLYDAYPASPYGSPILPHAVAGYPFPEPGIAVNVYPGLGAMPFATAEPLVAEERALSIHKSKDGKSAAAPAAKEDARAKRPARGKSARAAISSLIERNSRKAHHPPKVKRTRPWLND
ncbi:LysM peptidoglycan-binding domain-containing protein [Paenibacillus validus]|uniref:LysM peptidoglycan-binding domain-containing protein n=1 Tax=Paenibacillus validus TaxID=44253 RepID=A0A7X2Z6B2_9BACL|nr:LysM peptidoglycan-binding domain-containing protein [Paenibacillus validus]